MNNLKYQAALNFIVAATNGGDGMVKELNTLQELVDKFELVEKQNQIEKALDKACEELEQDVLFFKDLNFTKGIVQDSYTKEQWKAWCMKDVE